MPADDARELLLAKLLAGSGFQLSGGTSVPRRSGDAAVPLSSAQQRLWFLDRLSPGGAYLMPAVHRITGAVDLRALIGALHVVVARHEALRASIVEDVTGRPVHVIAAPGDARMPELVHHRLSAADSLSELVGELTSRPFQLDRAPLLRAALITVADDDHVLVLCAHHIVCDDLSLSVLTHDLLVAYQAILAGTTPDTAEPAVRFGDYLAWQHTRGGNDPQYWVDHLTGAPPLLDLPTDRRRPPIRAFRGASVPVDLSAELSDAVHALARRADATPFMVLLAAFSALLSRYSGSSDIVVGSPVANRSLPELDDLVGMFVNTIALRVGVDQDRPLGELLTRAREVAVSGLSHAGVPLEEVIERLNPPRDLGYNPVFQVMLVVNPAGPRVDSPGLAVRPADLGETPARFDLTLVVTDAPDGLVAHFDYDADLFDAATIATMATGLRRVLAAMTTDPDRPLWTVDLVAPEELVRVAAGPPAYEPAVLLDLIARWATDTPDAPAVIGEDRTISYAELDRAANRVAWRLHDLGVEPDTRVGLALPAGADAIVGVLGILRAGGAYVPLDPGHPDARLTFLLDDTRAAAVVTSSDHAGRFDNVVLVNGADARTGPPPVRIHPEHLAYVIHTSGSTGEPKGVMVRHAALTNLALAFRDLHGFGPHTRLLMVPPLSFDASVGDIFPALVSGAALVTVAEPAALTARRLREVCTTHGVTAVDTAAALWRQWVSELDSWPVETLTTMMVGGEAVPTGTLRAWAGTTGGTVALHNHYGPTEATVCAVNHRTIDGTELGGAASVPCGRPLPGVRAYVLDQHLRPVPTGVPGELFLGGAGVARGYLGAPARTAAAFLPDPYAAEPGQRMYRTGDLARFRADGLLEFLGRTDRQVKIRGHRVELGEVEAAVAALPQVGEACVVAAGDPARLVAYVVPAPGAAPTAADLREPLAERLPGYLVPSGVVLLDALPLTRHGKVDHAALPEPDAHLHRPAHVPPRTAAERTVAAIWARRLDRATVGATDNFFDLGGHSLQATGVLEDVRTELGVRLPVRALFEAPDLAAFAAATQRVSAPITIGPDLMADAELPDDITPAGPADGRHVLVTGATGLVGARLLVELLRTTDATVHCVVRGRSDRLFEVVGRLPDWSPAFTDRVMTHPGDASAPMLGLPERVYDDLCERVGTVYHAASLVNVVLPYERLRPDNVTATTEVLRFACRRRTKATHVISTLGTFFGSAYAGTVVTEADEPAAPEGITSPFAQSKWVGDALARAARRRGLPVSIYRPARITGDSRTGESKMDDVLPRLLATYAQLGSAPEDGAPFDMAPADFLATAIVRLSRLPHGDFHLRNSAGLPGGELGAGLRALGLPVAAVPRDEWMRLITEALDAGQDLPIGAFTGYAMPTELPTFDCAATDAALAGVGLAHPAPDPALLRTYLDYFVHSGLLPVPAGR